MRGMIEAIAFAVVFLMILLLAACSFGRAPQSARVNRTRPSDKTVDGYGGIRGWDYSYSPGVRDAAGPFPVGMKIERDKTETHDAYSKDDEDY